MNKTDKEKIIKNIRESKYFEITLLLKTMHAKIIAIVFLFMLDAPAVIIFMRLVHQPPLVTTWKVLTRLIPLAQ